jgi:hypothetical protein
MRIIYHYIFRDVFDRSKRPKIQGSVNEVLIEIINTDTRFTSMDDSVIDLLTRYLYFSDDGICFVFNRIISWSAYTEVILSLVALLFLLKCMYICISKVLLTFSLERIGIIK